MKGRSILLLTTLTAAAIALPVVYAQNQPAQAQQVTYKVVDGNKVDENTLQGWKTWRALDCQRCHGPQQQGLVGPSLIDGLKVIDKDEFKRTVFGGRLAKGMPDFSASKRMQDHWQDLYAYLKGRSDGKIQPGDLSPIDSK
ncbi:methanol dehydrogenase [Paraburkholderia sp. NMBU_R16]|uniref:c-type cytochrome n=1 Tax=Paraburkholderia sp. NMBU_R16 TaxID=2698676 RepID=UPI00156666F7|nr:cytochrome c [Paraburkholderia sp. NMBU_R16]NRO94329.1 methanol dehydrogenase [Paraburkholderia sp. NMBU_R16]